MAATARPALAGHRPTEAELRARRTRNRALGLMLFALVGLFYLITLAKLGLNVAGGH